MIKKIRRILGLVLANLIFLLLLFSTSNKQPLTEKKIPHWTINSMHSCNRTITRLPKDIQDSGKEWTGRNTSYFYSAYNDYRTNSVVIISIVLTGSFDYYCTLWFEQEHRIRVSKAIVVIIPDTHQKRYLGSFLRCYNPSKSKPSAVSISSAPCSRPLVTLQIVYPDKLGNKEKHWCLSPIHGNPLTGYLEAVTLHKLIGIDRATIYTSNKTAEKHLKNLDWIDVIHWQIPVHVNDIHYYGQCAAINDCLYRNMFSNRYMIFTDLDEIFLPRRNSPGQILFDKLLWQDLDTMQLERNNTISSFYGSSYLFGTPENLTSLASVNVVKRYQKPNIYRRKYIIIPNRIDYLSVHKTYSYPSYDEIFIPKSIAMLHHYRRCPEPETNCLGVRKMYNPIMIDEFALSLLEPIISLSTNLSITMQLHSEFS
ncbi:DgyrCDS14020 [Dimorphilus gyrociliatus]|uniref:Glycosyltransferase family 92 protein n=1 Tax=Dimorphilus gyrociliatus TaxID=2664684 RepID=A0A7I8WCH5_9ANNE|nr:DgyrCDS14020 [Dimorphilus gyrociliatus]